MTSNLSVLNSWQLSTFDADRSKHVAYNRLLHVSRKVWPIWFLLVIFLFFFVVKTSIKTKIVTIVTIMMTIRIPSTYLVRCIQQPSHKNDQYLGNYHHLTALLLHYNLFCQYRENNNYQTVCSACVCVYVFHHFYLFIGFFFFCFCWFFLSFCLFFHFCSKENIHSANLVLSTVAVTKMGAIYHTGHSFWIHTASGWHETTLICANFHTTWNTIWSANIFLAIFWNRNTTTGGRGWDWAGERVGGCVSEQKREA